MHAELRSQLPVFQRRYQTRVTHVNCGAPWTKPRQKIAVNPLRVESGRSSRSQQMPKTRRDLMLEKDYMRSELQTPTTDRVRIWCLALDAQLSTIPTTQSGRRKPSPKSRHSMKPNACAMPHSYDDGQDTSNVHQGTNRSTCYYVLIRLVVFVEIPPCFRSHSLHTVIRERVPPPFSQEPINPTESRTSRRSKQRRPC